MRNATAADIDKAFAVAAKGFRAWSRRPVEERAACLERMADLMEADRDRLLALLAAEAGKTLDDGIAEIREAVDFCRYYAGEARRLFSSPVKMPGPTGEDNRYLWRGRGVFACISPWNFPLAIFLGQVSAALVAGNAVLAKPAPQTPLIAYEAVRLLHQAGVPADALLFVPGGPDVGAALDGAFGPCRRRLYRLDPHCLGDQPGACRQGWADRAADRRNRRPQRHGRRRHRACRAGGRDDVVMSAFRSAGQRCSALRLLIPQEDVAEHMTQMIEGAARELKLGDPSLADTDVGPIIDEKQKAMLEAHIGDMQKTQKVRYAGQAPDGGSFAPHIVELGKPAALTKEVFGPVLHVVKWKAKELPRVLADIAASGYGLTLGIHSRIETTIKTVTEALDTGNVYVNRNMIGAVVGTQPFGGSGLSGTGFKAGGPAYLQRFALEQVISVNTAAAGGNASLIAMGDG